MHGSQTTATTSHNTAQSVIGTEHIIASGKHIVGVVVDVVRRVAAERAGEVREPFVVVVCERVCEVAEFVRHFPRRFRFFCSVNDKLNFVKYAAVLHLLLQFIIVLAFFSFLFLVSVLTPIVFFYYLSSRI